MEGDQKQNGMNMTSFWNLIGSAKESVPVPILEASAVWLSSSNYFFMDIRGCPQISTFLFTVTGMLLISTVFGGQPQVFCWKERVAVMMACYDFRLG